MSFSIKAFLHQTTDSFKLSGPGFAHASKDKAELAMPEQLAAGFLGQKTEADDLAGGG